MDTPKTMPVRPRNASSLVIYKQVGDDIQVLMGRRAKAHRFLPNVFVFPGGRIDKEDQFLETSGELSRHLASQLSKPGNLARAAATAAVRETWEETGLVIGDVVNAQLRPDLSQLEYIARAITPSINPIRFNTRFLMVDAKHTQGEIGGSGELLELDWYPISQALQMPVVDVTEFVLGELQDRLTTPTWNTSVIPIFTYRNGKPLIRRTPH